MNIFQLFVVTLVSFSLSTAWAGSAVKLEIQAMPAEPEVQAESAKVTSPNGDARQVKAPFIAVGFEILNKSDTDTVTIARMAFSASAAFDEDDEFISVTLKPPLSIAPGERKSTETLYLENLAVKPGDRQRISVSVTGWKNAGADAGDQFATGTGFRIQ